MWAWLNKAKAFRNIEDVPTTKVDADEKASVSLKEQMNSSKHLPGLARVFNEHQQASNTSQFLAMPEKVLEKILRYAVVEDGAIQVAAAHPEASSEKNRGVLSVCHRLREIGRPVFYKENIFEIQVARFDIKAVLPWLKIATVDDEIVSTEDTMDIDSDQSTVPGAPDETAAPAHTTRRRFAKPSPQIVKIFSKSFNYFVNPDPVLVEAGKAKPASRDQKIMLAYFLGGKLEATLINESVLPGEVYFVPNYEPHWQHLVEWMKLYHAGEAGRYAYEKGNSNGSVAVQGLFDLVQIEKEECNGWSTFEKRLYALRGMLAASDKEWLED